MNISKILVLTSVILVLLSLSVETVVAKDCTSVGCYINGTINRSDSGAALSGAVVYNASNVSQTYTTGANGFYNISNFQNGTHDLTVTAPSGFTSSTRLGINTTGADNASRLYTDKTLTIITPVNSAITASSITKNGAVISWTVSSGSNFANRVVYSLDSALGTNTFTTDWLNNTASPSITLANLQPLSTIYYRVESYNIANATSYSDTDTGNFNTLKAGVKSYYVTPTAVPAVVQTPASKGFLGLGSITGGKGGAPNKPILVFVTVVLIGAVAAVYLVKSGKLSPKVMSKKRK